MLGRLWTSHSIGSLTREADSLGAGVT